MTEKTTRRITKYGRVLGNFERGFVKFAGGTFEDMKKSIEEGGTLTFGGIAKTLGNDLRGDFDKLLHSLTYWWYLTTNTFLRYYF